MEVPEAPTACPFCTVPDSRIVGSNELAMAIRDGYPISPGHTLIIPKRHFASISQATTDELHSLWSLLAEARRSLDESMNPAGYNIGVNDGVAAGQTVMHLHVHLVPRYPGDRKDPRGGVRWIVPEKADYWSTRTSESGA